MNRHQPRRSVAGLSLLELLVSLAILSIMLLSLSGALSIGLQHFKRLEDRTEISAPTMHRLQLRNWLERAMPPARLATFARVFQGQETQMEFTSLAHTPFAPEAAALRVRVFLADRQLRYEAKAHGDDGIEIQNYTGALASGVTSIKLRYLHESDKQPSWRSTWEDPNVLPKAVRIDITQDDPGFQWPLFVIRTLYSSL